MSLYSTNEFLGCSCYCFDINHILVTSRLTPGFWSNTGYITSGVKCIPSVIYIQGLTYVLSKIHDLWLLSDMIYHILSTGMIHISILADRLGPGNLIDYINQSWQLWFLLCMIPWSFFMFLTRMYLRKYYVLRLFCQC